MLTADVPSAVSWPSILSISEKQCLPILLLDMTHISNSFFLNYCPQKTIFKNYSGKMV